ncbi:hypothetical protein WR25_04397 [Diploscapter pachys]|uniref:Uncharacterized protein n=1 Tax=Diploscapter pachys TaxID=2018661 RepID=A0A2A2KCQ0_9BILA|nr:hypothetical protein WR25_04397 [Diploscapter pachys]
MTRLNILKTIQRCDFECDFSAIISLPSIPANMSTQPVNSSTLEMHFSFQKLRFTSLTYRGDEPHPVSISNGEEEVVRAVQEEPDVDAEGQHHCNQTGDYLDPKVKVPKNSQDKAFSSPDPHPQFSIHWRIRKFEIIYSDVTEFLFLLQIMSFIFVLISIFPASFKPTEAFQMSNIAVNVKSDPAAVSCSAESTSPSFLQETNNPAFNTIFGTIWQSSLPVDEKILCLDSLAAEHLPYDTRKKYRIWRFQFARDKLPEFVSKESEGLQWAIKSMFNDTENLEELARSMWHLKSAFNDESALNRYLENECLKRPDCFFPDFVRPKSLTWTCRWVYEDDLVGSHNWTLLIDVLDSPLTEAFLRLSGKDNDFGAGGSSLSLQGSVLAPSGPFAVHLVIPSPPDSPLVRKSHSPDLDTSSWRPSTQRGERENFVRVGKIREMPKELSRNSTENSLRIEIIDTKCHY